MNGYYLEVFNALYFFNRRGWMILILRRKGKGIQTNNILKAW